MKRTFINVFPLPKILAMPAVGLSISDHALRYVEFGMRNGIHVLKTWGEYPLEEGIVVDGMVAQKEKLVAALVKMAKEKSVSWVRVALPEEKAFIYSTTVSFPENPSATKKETALMARMLRERRVPREAVEATLSQNIPLTPAETIFDFGVTSFDEKNRTAEVQVYAFPINIANSYADAITAAGLVPLSFETESQAIARAVLPTDIAGTHVVLHIMTHKTIIAVVSQGGVMYASTARLEAGADKDVDLVTIRDEVMKVVSYWHSRGKEKKDRIQSIVISGNLEKHLDIPDYISKHTRISSRLAKVWDNAFSVNQHVPDISFEKSLEYATAAGLALGSVVHSHVS